MCFEVQQGIQFSIHFAKISFKIYVDTELF